jgi:hypothetical protein
MPRIELALSAPVIVVLLTTLLATVLAFLYYRTTLPQIPLSGRILLALLRAGTMCLLVLLIFQPLVHLTVASSDSPVLAVLVDNSRSMRLVDRTGTRATTLRSLLHSEPLRILQRSADIRYFTFGVQTRPAPTLPADTLDFAEGATDISAALRELQNQKERLNIRAAVLLSDGVFTLGQNPVYDAEHLAVPLYTIGIGDSAEPKDLSVARVSANEICYSGSRTPVDLTIKSSGYGGERVEVTLSEGTRELDRTMLSLRGGSQEYPVHLSYQPVGDGMKRLTAKVSFLPEEVTTANNQRTFTVRVLKSRLNIAVLAGAPSSDETVLRQALVEQPTLLVRSLTEKRDGGFYEGVLSTALTDTTDCLALIDFPTHATSSSTLDRIAGLLEQRNLPILFIAGRSVDVTRFSAFGSVLPFTATAAGTTEEYTTVRPEDIQKGNPILELGLERGFDLWNHLPPIYRRTGMYRARPEATVLATSVVQNVPTREPILLTRSMARQKSVAVMGYGLWRWRLLAQGDNATEHFLEEFVRSAIQWLTTPDDTRRFKVITTKESFAEGESVEFTGQLYNASAQPIDDARIRVLVQKGDQVAEASLRSDGHGRYEGKIEGLEGGDYSYNASAEWRGAMLGKDGGKFSVGEIDLEFRDVRMNIELLRQLALRTGGQYFNPAELSRLDSTVRAQASFAPREVRSITDLELWHWKYLLSMMVLLFSAEWLLRKWHGML